LLSPQQQQDESTVEPFNPELTSSEIETALQAAAGELGGWNGVDRQAISAISGLAKGDISYAAKNLANSVGMEHEEAKAFIQGVYERYEEKSANYISKTHQVDGAAALQWAASNLDAAERSSIAHLVYLGKSSALDGLAHKYIKAMSIQQSRNYNQ
jgi:hypothetical protein